MDSRVEWLLEALLNGESIDDFEPRSRLEQYLESIIEKSGTDGLEIPRSRLDALLYEMADKAPDNYASAVEEGRNQEWSDFWDEFQDYGTRTSYAYCFCSRSWDEKVFKPKYDIIVSGNANWMFENSGLNNLKQILKDCGVVLDTSKATGFGETFAYCNYSGLTHIPTLDIRSSVGLTHTFRLSRMIVEIEKIILKDDGSQTFTSAFHNLDNLEAIVFEGVIGTDIYFGQSPKLTHDSLMSIINALKDYSADTSGTVYTLTLGSTNIEKLTTDEQDIVSQKGWTLK